MQQILLFLGTQVRKMPLHQMTMNIQRLKVPRGGEVLFALRQTIFRVQVYLKSQMH